mgnify:FL=1
MPDNIPAYATLDGWITSEAIPFALDSTESLNAAADRLMASAGSSMVLLALGEPLHGGQEFLVLRNRLFQRLVEAHGFSAIAIESSFTRAGVVNEYVAGRGPDSYEAIRETGFSHGFGSLEANRELIEWMREANADPDRTVKLRFYGVDSPTEMTSTDSPRQALAFVLDYLAALDGGGEERRQRIDSLIGADADWESFEAMMDPARAVGLSPAASALRIETEDLISELDVRRPELVAKGGWDRYAEARQYAKVARQLLNYHAEIARESPDRISRLLGIRDAIMADNIAYAVGRERGRGRVLVFAANGHVQRGQMRWQLGPHANVWWPAGAHLDAIFEAGYVVIGTGLGVSAENGIGQPEAGTLEARLMAAPGPARFVPTYRGAGLPTAEIDSLPVRSGSTKNSTYFPLTAQSLTDFDWLALLDEATYTPGGPPLPG